MGYLDPQGLATRKKEAENEAPWPLALLPPPAAPRPDAAARGKGPRRRGIRIAWFADPCVHVGSWAPRVPNKGH